MKKDHEIPTSAGRRELSRFGLPVYGSESSSVEYVGLSSKGHNGQLDLIELGYVVPPRAEPDCEQPSVWTWSKRAIHPDERPLVTHGRTYLASHDMEFRSGRHVLTPAESDRLAAEVAGTEATRADISVDGKATDALIVRLRGREFASLEIDDVVVTVAGPVGFADEGIRQVTAV